MESQIKEIVHAADFHGFQRFTQLVDGQSEDAKGRLRLVLIKDCLQYLACNPEQTRQFKSTSMILNACRVQLAEWSFQDTVNVLMYVFDAYLKDGMPFHPVIQDFARAALMCLVHADCKFRFQGSLLSGNVLANGLVSKLFDLDWRDPLNYVLFLKSYPLKCSRLLSKTDELFTEARPEEDVCNGIAHHLFSAALIAGLDEPKTMSRFFALAGSVACPSLMESLQLLLTHNLGKKYMKWTTNKDLLLGSGVALALALRNAKAEDLQSICRMWSNKLEFIDKWRLLVRSEPRIEELKSVLMQVVEYWPASWPIESLLQFLLKVQPLSIEPLYTLSRKRQLTFEQLSLFKDISEAQLPPYQRLHECMYDFCIRLISERVDYFLQNSTTLFYAMCVCKVQAAVLPSETFRAILSLLQADVSDRAREQLALMVLTSFEAPWIIRFLNSDSAGLDPLMLTRIIGWRLDPIFADYGPIRWMQLLKSNGAFPIGSCMLLLLKHETNFERLAQYGRRMNDVVKRLLESSLTLEQERMELDERAEDLLYAGFLDLAAAALLWVLSGHVPKGVSTVNAAKTLLKRILTLLPQMTSRREEALWAAIPDAKVFDDFLLPLIADDFVNQKQSRLIHLLLSNSLPLFSSQDRDRLALKRCELFPLVSNYQYLLSLSPAGYWLKERLKISDDSIKENHVLVILQCILEFSVELDELSVQCLRRRVFGSIATTKKIYEVLYDLASASLIPNFFEELLADCRELLGAADFDEDEQHCLTTGPVGERWKSLSLSNVTDILVTLLRKQRDRLEGMVWALRKASHVSSMDEFKRIVDFCSRLSVILIDGQVYEVLLGCQRHIFEVSILIIRSAPEVVPVIGPSMKALVEGIYLMLPAQQQLQCQAFSATANPKAAIAKESGDDGKKENGKRSNTPTKKAKDNRAILLARIEREAERIPQLVSLIEEYLYLLSGQAAWSPFMTRSVARDFRLDPQELVSKLT